MGGGIEDIMEKNFQTFPPKKSFHKAYEKINMLPSKNITTTNNQMDRTISNEMKTRR
jgi:hypothetical protein